MIGGGRAGAAHCDHRSPGLKTDQMAVPDGSTRWRRETGPFLHDQQPEQPALSRPDWVTGSTGEKEDKYKQVSVSYGKSV